MPQGKLKVKTQVPGNSKKTQKVAKQGNKKGLKKQGSSKKNKVKKALEATLRTNIEHEIRARATSAGQTLMMEKKSASKGKKT